MRDAVAWMDKNVMIWKVQDIMPRLRGKFN